MNDEQLSALMDDELPADVGGVAIDQLLANSAARATWGRYHLIGDALRTPPPESSVPVRKIVPITGSARRGMSPLSLGLAAAAGLAAIALLVPALAPPSSNLGSVATTAVVPPAGRLSAPSNRQATADLRQDASTLVNQITIVRDDEAQQRMSPYVTNFNELRARQRTPGVHPYVRIVGYETH